MKKHKKILSLTLCISLILGSSIPVMASGAQFNLGNTITVINQTTNTQNSVLPEIKNLLQKDYVDPVPDDVLNAPTVDEMLKKLGDPWTVYFSPSDYDSFVSSVNLQFSGIGVTVDSVPEGVKITSVFSGSPAEEAGLKVNDIVTSVDGQSLAGKALETAVPLLRGPEGSKVHLTVLRGNLTLSLTAERRKIDIPTVSGQVLEEGKNLGYIAIKTFGLTTPAEFEATVKSLQEKGVNRWIIDIRGNPGGYVDTALAMAGYFIGHQPAMQVKDRSGITQNYLAVQQDFMINQPMIFLIDQNSASASEILSAAVKDYHKATFIGTKTFGKGKMQGMYKLSDGGALKMTIARFYSPQGNMIDQTGVLPDIDTGDLDALQTAEILLQEDPTGGSDRSSQAEPSGTTGTNHLGYIQLHEKSGTFVINMAKEATPENWESINKILASVTNPEDLWIGSTHGWTWAQASDLKTRWPVFFPGYQDAGDLKDIPLDKKFYVHFSAPVDWSTVNSKTVELVESNSGQRIEATLDPVSINDMRVIPKSRLENNKTYWLVIHPEIKDRAGHPLSSGAVAVAQTPQTKTKIQESQVKVQSMGQTVRSLSSTVNSGYGEAFVEFKK